MTRHDAWRAALALALLVLPLLPAGFSVFRLPASFGDLVAYHYPMRHLAATALECGRLPFWNPYLFSGIPLAANPQSALYYPPALLGALFPLTLALSWDCWLHLFWAALGCALLARRGGVKGLGAWALGLTYALCPFVVYRVTEGIPTLLASLAWAPWCWLFWVGGRRGLLGAALALTLLSGHPQFCALNALGLALWTACAKPSRLPSLALEGALAGALTPVLWAPLFEFLGQSVRRGWPMLFSLGYSVGPRELLTWLWPGALGDPLRGGWGGPPSIFFETTGVYLSAALVLSAIGLVARRKDLGLWALLACGLFLARGGHNPAYRWLLAHTAMCFLRTPSRALFLDLWALWLAAAAGWRALARRGQGRLATGLAAMGVVLLLAWDAPFLKAQDVRPYLSISPRVAQQIGDTPYRILGDPGLANENKAMLYRAMNVNGYEAFFLASYAVYAARSEGKAAADASRTYLSNADTPEMRRLGVAYRLDSDGRFEKTAERAYPLAYFVDARGRHAPGAVRLSRLVPERWTVDAAAWPAAAAGLVLSQSDYPGWRAYLNGEQVALRRFDGLLQAVARPDGPAEPLSLVALFRPTGYDSLVACAAAAWSLWLGLMLTDLGAGARSA